MKHIKKFNESIDTVKNYYDLMYDARDKHDDELDEFVDEFMAKSDEIVKESIEELLTKLNIKNDNQESGILTDILLENILNYTDIPGTEELSLNLTDSIKSIKKEYAEKSKELFVNVINPHFDNKMNPAFDGDKIDLMNLNDRFLFIYEDEDGKISTISNKSINYNKDQYKKYIDLNTRTLEIVAKK